MKHTLAILTALLLAGTASAEVPYPAALDAAAVVESRIADINREALVLGNGDLIGLLWQRGGTLCIRVAKNDIWDARVDTSQDVPLMKVDVPNNKWSGGGERKSHFCRNTYVSADPFFCRFGPFGRPKTPLALAPEGVERSNVKMGNPFFCSF